MKIIRFDERRRTWSPPRLHLDDDPSSDGCIQQWFLVFRSPEALLRSEDNVDSALPY